MKGEPAAVTQHPSRLAVETAFVADVHSNVLHPDDIERSLFKGEVDGITDMERDGVVQPYTLIELSSGLDVALRYVDARHATAVIDRKRTGRTSDPAADVEHPVSRTKSGESREVAIGGAPANMEILERDEVAWRKDVDIFSGG